VPTFVVAIAPARNSKTSEFRIGRELSSGGYRTVLPETGSNQAIRDHTSIMRIHPMMKRIGMGMVGTERPSIARPVNAHYRTIKRGLDKSLSCFLLPIALPVIAICWILVKLTSRGPGFYVQERLGQHGRRFRIYKIRTMYLDSERFGICWCRPGDPRITPVGRILRSTHLDELPQLWNILRGEMSLVGPRPERPEIVNKLEQVLPNYRIRLSVPAGLTGLAQVRQPPDTDIASVQIKLQYDLCYVDHMSLSLDLRVLLGTLLKCLGMTFSTIRRLVRLPDVSSQADGQPDSDPSLVSTALKTDPCAG
jgi:lipopolysaccharide/colanic/teichoic acid biosynthesis glycosyltransferase